MTTGLLTDKYELTMLSAALRNGTAHKRVTFEAFARKLPRGRRYGVVAGMARVKEAIEIFSFSPEQIDFLRQDGLDEDTLYYLENYRFSGSVFAYRDGDLYFPHSPVLAVEGTFGEAVLLETVILSILNHDCAVASAASRIVQSARGIPVMELGSRRTHEQAAVAAAAATWIGGFSGTSNLEAGATYSIPVFGTSAHAFTLAHETEVEGFRAQVDAQGVGTTLLVDTYDTEQGIRNAIAVAGTELGGIRIDSGDLYEETVRARQLLDELGATNTKIVVSSDLDEYVIEDLMTGHEAPAPIDAFGVGTRVVTGSGHPTASMVYKLVEIEDDNGNRRPVAKAARGKRSVGGRKTPYRILNNQGLVAEIVGVGNVEQASALLPDRHHRLKAVQMTTFLFGRDFRPEPVASALNAAKEHHQELLALLPESAKSIEASDVAAIPSIDYNGNAI